MCHNTSRDRAHMVRLNAQGWNVAAIAEIFECQAQTVRLTLRRWKQCNNRCMLLLSVCSSAVAPIYDFIYKHKYLASKFGLKRTELLACKEHTQ